MSDEAAEPIVDLAYVGRALQRLTSEVASLRDDMHVLTAIVQRLDNSQGRILEEIQCHAPAALPLRSATAPARRTDLTPGGRA